uniref:Basonuclin zinc finger protein 2 n=1 Tax=Sander lucioperca TaxID=283035 RepID=A0A8C9XAX8_SANLU
SKTVPTFFSFSKVCCTNPPTAIRCTLVNCTCECFQPGKIHLRTCDHCKHGWVAHALDKLSTQHLYHPTQVEIVQCNVVFDISSLMLYGTQAVPVRLKILLDRLFSVLKQEEVLHILHGLGWTLRDYVRGYILQDAAGKVLDRWTIMSREEEIITLQQFLRFGETKSIVELMAIQEKEGQAVTVPSSKTDSGIRTFIESNNRSRSPGLLTHLENSSPSSIHHFENIPNSLAFLLPFQYINPVSAPMLGLPPNGMPMEQSALRLREPSLPNQGEQVDTSESEVSLSPFRTGQSPSRGALGAMNNIEPKTEPNNRASPISPTPSTQQGRVCCNSCGKTFYDKGTLKIHYNAVHLKIKHRCTIEGCNMVFSSLRSRNRHSANPNPRLHMPMLRNNRDKDLIRSTTGTPVISSTKNGGFTLTSPGRPPLGFTTPPVDPMLQSPLQSPLVFPSLKSVQPVQPVPPFYRTLLSPADLVSPPVSLPTSPILPTTTNIPMSHRLHTTSKPRKSSMPVKIEKEVIDVADEYEDKDDDDDDIHHNHHHHSSLLHNSVKMNGNCNSNNNSGSGTGNHSGGSGCLDKEQDDEGCDEAQLRKEMEGKGHSSPSPHQPPIRIKEELNDPTYDMFCMGQYGLYNGGMAAAAAAASMAALHESFISSMGYGANPCSSPDPKICYVCKKSFKSSYSMKLHYKNVHLKEMHVCTVAGCNAAFPSRRSRDRHSSNINLHRKLLTKELDDIVLDPQLPPLPKDLRAELLAKIYAGHHMGLDRYVGMGIGGASLRPTGMNHNAHSPMSSEYPHHPLNHNLKNHHTNGFSRAQPDDYMVLDLSTTSSVQSSSSVHSSHESDEGSDEGILLDDLEEEGEEDEEEGNSEGEDCSQHAEGRAERSNGGNSGILCNICHKMYSNKGTLRVHYKTVHLREMHKCKIPGCNMVFSSVRSRNRHSQNPNLHKNMPFSTIID